MTKRYLFISICLLLGMDVFSQPYQAKKAHVSGIVISRYSLCKDSSYVKTETTLLINESAYPFINYRDGIIISENKYLFNTLGGDISEYENIPIYSKEHSIKNDLTICPFDSTFFDIPSCHSIVYAKDGFFMNDSVATDLFAIYNFEGIVVFYQGEWPYDKKEPSKESWEEFGMDYNCGCPDRKQNFDQKTFAILLQTKAVSRFTPNPINQWHYHHTLINYLNLMFCEM